MPRAFRRPPPRLEISRTVVIACEGSKTEPGYFKAIKRTLKLPTVRIEIQTAPGTDPRSIVDFAVSMRQELIDNDLWDEAKEDCAWAVYDGAEHRSNSRRSWDEALDIAQRKKIALAVSNPCFELWYLLHYQEQNALLSQENALRRLKRHLPHYEKSLVLYPKPLQPLTPHAVDRARQVHKRALTDGLELHEYPCAAGVADLVELLLSLERRV